MADKIELILYLVDRVSSIEPINISLVNLVSKLCVSFVQNETRRRECQRTKKKKEKNTKNWHLHGLLPSGKKRRSIIRNQAWRIRYTRHLAGIENYLTTHQFPANREPSDNWLVIPQAFIVCRKMSNARKTRPEECEMRRVCRCYFATCARYETKYEIVWIVFVVENFWNLKRNGNSATLFNRNR